MVITYNTVEGAEVGSDKGEPYGRRSGIITGLDTSLAGDKMLSSVMPFLPAYNAPYPDPLLSRALLQRHVISTFKGVNNKAKFTLFYGVPDGQTGSALFYIERQRQMIQVDTQHHPKEKEPFLFRWVDPWTEQKRPWSTATLSMMTPMMSLVATGYTLGEPPAAYTSAYGSVNATTWQGYPIGYWMYAGADDRTYDKGNSYTIRLEFLTRVTEDWSSYAVYRDPATGLVLPVKKADMLFLKNLPYAYSINRTKNGVLKTGLYATNEFNTSFGF